MVYAFCRQQSLVDGDMQPTKFEIWRGTLEFKDFTSKTEYVESKFNNKKNKDDEVVKLDSREIPKNEYVQYLRSIIHKG